MSRMKVRGFGTWPLKVAWLKSKPGCCGEGEVNRLGAAGRQGGRVHKCATAVTQLVTARARLARSCPQTRCRERHKDGQHRMPESLPCSGLL